MPKFDLSDLVITGVRTVATIYTPKDTVARRRNRSRWAVILKYEGETVYRSGGKELRSDRSNMILLPRGCSYEWRCTRAGHYAVVEFDADATAPEPLSFPVGNSDRILKIFRGLELERSRLGAPRVLRSIRDTYSILLLMLEGGDLPKKSDRSARIAPAVDYISEHYRERITNDRLAALSGTSTVNFRKLFTAEMGVSPIAYAHALRIEKAKEMLRSDYGTLSDLALSLGYPSLYDFSRDFKKHTGVAPSKYAKGR